MMMASIMSIAPKSHSRQHIQMDEPPITLLLHSNARETHRASQREQPVSVCVAY